METAVFDVGLNSVKPFFVKGINCSFFRFIRPRAVYDALEQVSVKEGQGNALDKRRRQFEARRLFGAFGVKRHRDDRNLRETGILERFSDQRNVVCRTTSAACLCHHDGNVVEVVFAALQCFDHLTDRDDCRVACIIVDVFDAFVNRMLSFNRQVDDVVAGCS